MLKILFAIILFIICICMFFSAIILHRLGTIMKYENEKKEINKK